MEVHAHTHTARKKWSHYLWEFLMLFLAVFCGFLAENVREHRVEKHRATQLAKSLYVELKADSVDMALRVKNRIRAENSLKWLMKYFKDSSMISFSKEFSIHFLYGIHFRTPLMFEARMAILDQLKNSGSLRYFKSEKLQNLISALSASISYIAERQALETQVRANYVNPFIVEHYDYDFDRSITKDGTLPFGDALKNYETSDEFIPFNFKHTTKFDRESAVNMCGFYGMSGLRPTRQQHYQRYIDLNKELLQELRKEYHME